MNLAAEYCDRFVVLRRGRLLVDGPVRAVFSQTDLLSKSYLRPPLLTLFGQAMKEYGLPNNALNVDEMYEYVSKNLKG
jgi:energy-coupling factor transport system ATP-binding protein